jgi:hypothetical protein
MGYFDAAYVVVMEETKDGVALTRTHYATSSREKILFFWSEGTRPIGLKSYADNTLLCSSELSVTPGYPSKEILGKGPRESSDQFLVDEDFSSWSDSSLFIFHFLLPSRYVPCPDRIPLDIPSEPSLTIRSGERLSATFIVKGTARLRFWARKLENSESLEDFEIDRLFNKPIAPETKATMEVNLGLVKFTFGNK